MYLDPATTRLLAAERVSRLHAEATTTRRRERPTRTRVWIGNRLVGLGLRLAGPSTAPEREGLTALPPACL